MARLYWIEKYLEGNLAIMAAPRREEHLDEVILGWKAEGIDIVVSLIEEDELPGLVEAERELCQEFGLHFFHYPIRDKSVPPSLNEISKLSDQLARSVSMGEGIAIHCRAGIGRSASLAACVLVRLGIDGDTALDMIAEGRGLEIPETEAQRQWVLKFSQLAFTGRLPN